MTRTFLLTLASLALGAAPALAQPSLDLTFGSGLDTLALTGAGADGDAVTAVSLAAEQQVLDQRLRLHYSFDGTTSSMPGEWGTQLHVGGATWRLPVGAQASHALYAGGTVTARRNGESWEAAAFNGLGAFLNAEFKPTPTITLRTGYQFDRRVFADYAPLDQSQHQVFGSALVNLATRTTLVGEVYGGWKTYDGVGPQPVMVGLPEITGSGSGTGGISAGSGPGNGSIGSGSTGSGAAGGIAGGGTQARRPARPSFMPAVHAFVALDAGVPPTTASQVTLYGRVAQGLADRTGLAMDLVVRETFGDLPPAVINTPARFFDDGVYDDPFASDAASVTARLTQLWPRLGELRVSGSWAARDYTSTPAHGLDGLPLADGTLRSDRVWRAGARFEFPMLASRTGPWQLGVTAAYDYAYSRSTDVYYRYDSHVVAVGASVRY